MNFNETISPPFHPENYRKKLKITISCENNFSSKFRFRITTLISINSNWLRKGIPYTSATDTC